MQDLLWRVLAKTIPSDFLAAYLETVWLSIDRWWLLSDLLKAIDSDT